MTDHEQMIASQARLEVHMEHLIKSSEASAAERAALKDQITSIEKKVDAHIETWTGYRNWFVGFAAAVTLIFTSIWTGIKFVGAEALQALTK